MSVDTNNVIRAEIGRILAQHGIAAPSPSDSLFLSGRLDSIAAMEVLVALEEHCGIDLGDPDFDITQIDTLESLEALVAKRIGSPQEQAQPSSTLAKLVGWSAFVFHGVLGHESPTRWVVPALLEVA